MAEFFEYFFKILKMAFEFMAFVGGLYGWSLLIKTVKKAVSK